MRDPCNDLMGGLDSPRALHGGGVPARQRGPYISRRALARAGAGGCCACRLGVLGTGRAARAPAPGSAAGKTKTPVSGSRYRGFVRQSIT